MKGSPDHEKTNVASAFGIVLCRFAAPWQHQGPLLLTWYNFNPSMDK